MTNAYMLLASFTESQRRTLRLIADYVASTSRECFTYRGLRAYWDRCRMYDLEWHTVERNVRRLAELGWLARKHYGRRRVVFCVTDALEQLLCSWGWL